MYNHENPTRFTAEQCEDAVGKHGTLALTGTVVGCGNSDAGPYVKFLLDERWGFGEFRLTVDLDMIVLDD